MQQGREKGRELLAPVSSRFYFFFSRVQFNSPPPPPPPPPSELCVLLYERLKQATPTDIPLVIPFLVTFSKVLTLNLGICFNQVSSGVLSAFRSLSMGSWRVQLFCCRLSDLLLVYGVWWFRETLKSFF